MPINFTMDRVRALNRPELQWNRPTGRYLHLVQAHRQLIGPATLGSLDRDVVVTRHG